MVLISTFVGAKQKRVAEGRIWCVRSGLMGVGPVFPSVTLPLHFAASLVTMGAIKLSHPQPRAFCICTITGETFGACFRFSICLKVQTASAPTGLIPGCTEPWAGAPAAPGSCPSARDAGGIGERCCVPPYYSGQSTGPCSNNYIS